MGCDERGDGDGDNNNNNNLRRSVDEDEVPYTGLRTRFVCSTHRYPATRQQINASRQKLKELGLLEPKPRVTKDDPRFGYTIVETLGGPEIGYVINGQSTLASWKRRKAEKRKKKKQAGSKPVVNPVAGSSRATATGTKAMGIQRCFFKHPREDLAESTESLLENLIPAADSFLEIAKAEGGSVLKRHRVDLGESSDILAENLNSASDPSPTAGTEAEEKGGSVPNKGVGESSANVVESLNPGADSSAINVATCVQAEVKRGFVLKRHAADPSAIGTVASVKGGSVLIKDLGKSSEVLLKSAEPYSQYMRHCFI